MANLEEVLSDLPKEDYLLDDVQYIIDENLRTITIPEDGVVLGVIGDKNVNRVNFQMPRYYNGFDMSTFKCRINYVNANGDVNFYDVEDLTIIDESIYFTWLVDGTAAAYIGETKFVVRLYRTDGTKVTQNFYTTYNTASVLEGLIVDETAADTEDFVLHFQRLLEEYCYEICGPIMARYAVTEDMVSDVLKAQISDKAYVEIVAHSATTDEIDAIINGTYESSGVDPDTDDHSTHIADTDDIDNMMKDVFKDEEV